MVAVTGHFVALALAMAPPDANVNALDGVAEPASPPARSKPSKPVVQLRQYLEARLAKKQAEELGELSQDSLETRQHGAQNGSWGKWVSGSLTELDAEQQAAQQGTSVAKTLGEKGKDPTPTPTPEPTPMDFRHTLVEFESVDNANWERFDQEMQTKVMQLETQLTGYMKGLQNRYATVMNMLEKDSTKWYGQWENLHKLKQMGKDMSERNEQLYKTQEAAYDEEEYQMKEDVRKAVAQVVPLIQQQLKNLLTRAKFAKSDNKAMIEVMNHNITAFDELYREKVAHHKKHIVDLSFDNQEWMKEFYAGQTTQLKRLCKLAFTALDRADKLEKNVLEIFKENFAQQAATKADRIQFISETKESMQNAVLEALEAFHSLVDTAMQTHDTKWDETVQEAKDAEKQLRKDMKGDLGKFEREFGTDENDLGLETSVVERELEHAEDGQMEADDEVEGKKAQFEIGKAQFNDKYNTLQTDVLKSLEKSEKYINTTYGKLNVTTRGLALKEKTDIAQKLMRATTEEKQAAHDAINNLQGKKAENNKLFTETGDADDEDMVTLNNGIKTERTALKSTETSDSTNLPIGLEPMVSEAERVVNQKLRQLRDLREEKTKAVLDEVAAHKQQVRLRLSDPAYATNHADGALGWQSGGTWQAVGAYEPVDVSKGYMGQTPVYAEANEAVRQLTADETTYNSEFRDATRQFDGLMEESDGPEQQIKTRKDEMRAYMQESTDKTRQIIQATEGISNNLVPDTYQYAENEAVYLMDSVQAIEDLINQGTSATKNDANLGVQTLTAGFAQDGTKATQEMRAELSQEAENAHTDIDRVVHHSSEISAAIATRGAELQTKADAGLSEAQRTGDEIPKIQKDYEELTKAATTEAESVKPDVQAFTRDLMQKEHELRTKSQYLVDHSNKFVETKIRGFLQSIEARAEKLSDALKKKSDKASDYVGTQLAAVIVKCKDLERRLQELDAEMRGVAADSEAWEKQLIDDISGAAGQAKRMAMLEGATKLERQAAVDERFRNLTSMVNQQVAGLDEGSRAAVQMLIDGAKQEAQLIVHSEQYSEEEQRERLAKLDAFMHANIQGIMDQSHEVDIAIDSTGKLGTEAEQEVQERLDALKNQMDSMDAGAAVVHDRDSAMKTGATLTELIADADQELRAMSASFQKNLALKSGQHEMEASHLETALKADLQAAEDDLKVKQLSRDEDTSRIKDVAANQTEELDEMLDNLELLTQESDQTGLSIAERMGEHKHARHQRQDSVLAFRDRFTGMSVNVMEATVQLMLDLHHVVDRSLKKGTDQVSKWADRFRALEQTDAYKLLKEIHDADVSIDKVGRKQSDMKRWADVYDRDTGKWRKAVAASVDDLGGALGAELQAIEQQAKDYEKALKAAMGEEQTKALEEAMNVMHGEDADFETAAGSIGDETKRLELLAKQDAVNGDHDTEAAAAAVSNGFDKSTTDGVAQEQKAAAERLEAEKKTDAALNGEVDAYLSKKDEEAQAAKAEQQGHISDLRDELIKSHTQQGGKYAGMGLLTPVGASLIDKGARKEAMAAALARNRALSSKHEELMQRLAKLELPIALTQIAAESHEDKSKFFDVMGDGPGPGDMEAMMGGKGGPPMMPPPGALALMGAAPPMMFPNPGKRLLDQGRAENRRLDEIEPRGDTEDYGLPRRDLHGPVSGFTLDKKWQEMYRKATHDAMVNKEPADQKKMDSLEGNFEEAEHRYRQLNNHHRALVNRLRELELPVALKQAELHEAHTEAEESIDRKKREHEQRKIQEARKRFADKRSHDEAQAVAAERKALQEKEHPSLLQQLLAQA